MGSVSCRARCPNCGGDLRYEFWHHTGEESGDCRRCGLSYSRMIDPDHKWFPLPGMEHLPECRPKFKMEVCGGYGIVDIEGKYTGTHIAHSFRKFPTKEVVEEFMAMAEAMGDPEHTFITVCDPATHRIACLLGTMPPDSDEEPYYKDLKIP